MVSKKDIKITKQMQEKHEKEIQFFYSRTKAQSDVRTDHYLSFIGCGVLKEPTAHIINKANPFWLYAINLNRDCTDIEKVVNFEMTIAELLALKKAIDDLIDIYVNELGGVIPDIKKGFQEQQAKLEKEVIFKKEE